jgi:hypothetical protein
MCNASNGFIGRRSRSSVTSSSTAGRSSEDLSNSPTMDTRSLHQVSIPSTPVKPDVTVVVKEGNLSDLDENSTQQTKVLAVASKPQTITRTSSIQINHVMETTRIIKGRIIRELDDVDENYFKSVNLESYLEFIVDQRLIHMPHKGSQWDRVLKAAEFFGLQIYSFGSAVSHFVEESKYASVAALASCRLLLEVCACRNSNALVRG